MILPSAPTGLPALAALALGAFAFVVALIAARRGRERERGSTRAWSSIVGIALQGFAIALTGAGPERVVLDPLGLAALTQAAVVLVLMSLAVALFVWASRTMGREWSLIARTRADHRLVTTGPFAYLRHPIYVALAFLLVAVAVATGHYGRMLLTLPLYALGTWLRIRHEERLLSAAFAAEYDAYAARVKRFVPTLF